MFKSNKDEWFPHLILQTKHAFESTYFMIKCLCWLYNVVVEYVKQRPVARKEIIAHPYFTYKKFLSQTLSTFGTFRSLCMFIFCKQRWWRSDSQPGSHQKGGLHYPSTPGTPGHSPKGASEGAALLKGLARQRKLGQNVTSAACSSLSSDRVAGNKEEPRKCTFIPRNFCQLRNETFIVYGTFQRWYDA